MAVREFPWRGFRVSVQRLAGMPRLRGPVICTRRGAKGRGSLSGSEDTLHHPNCVPDVTDLALDYFDHLQFGDPDLIFRPGCPGRDPRDGGLSGRIGIEPPFLRSP